MGGQGRGGGACPPSSSLLHLLLLLPLVQQVRCQAVADPRCGSAFGNFPDATSCERYIACWGGRGFTQRCGNNLVFNPVTRNCQTGLSCPGLDVAAPDSGQRLRLRGGVGAWAGQLQVRYQGTWAWVDAASWSHALGQLVCRQLGFTGYEGGTSVLASGGAASQILRLECPALATSVRQCTLFPCTACTPDTQVASIRCTREGSSGCPQTGGSWERWGESCYLVLDSYRASRDAGRSVCKERGGQLVAVDTQEEHWFVSELLMRTDEALTFYTDGRDAIYNGENTWAWEQARQRLKYARWWPGWNTTGLVPAPTPSLGTCLLLRRSFPLAPSGQQLYDAGFHFFSAGECGEGRALLCEAKVHNAGTVGPERPNPLLRPFSNPTTPATPTIFTTTPTTTTTQKVRCQLSEHTCADGSRCVAPAQVCDGERDCPGGDDEHQCKRFLREFEEHSGQTLLARVVLRVLPRTALGVCAKACIDLRDCKGFVYDSFSKQCSLSSNDVASSGLTPSTRESFHELTSRRGTCGGRVQCLNGKCVGRGRACDGVDDCGDGTDEAQCRPTLKYETVLVGGSGGHEGNVRLKVGDEWRWVCDDGWGFTEADLLCRDLGYPGADTFTRNNHFGTSDNGLRRSEGVYWLDDVACRGTEASFFDCPHSGLAVHNCGPTEIAGVVCRRDGVSSCAANEFRCGGSGRVHTCIPRSQVCNGAKDCFDNSDEAPGLCEDVGVVRLETKVEALKGTTSGTVFVKHKGRWGTVCDDNFREKHATVVCRSLGYEGGWAVPYPRAFFGRGSGDILLDEPQCQGHESWLGECGGVEWGVTDCDHSEDVGVLCSDQLEVRLAGGPTRSQGRVEVKLSGRWGTVCDDDFDDYDAKVVCRMLGYEGDALAHKSARHGQGAGPVWLDSVDCTGDEQDLRSCKKSPPGASDCVHAEDVSVTCYGIKRGIVDRGLDAALPDGCGSTSSSSSSFLLSNLAKIVGGTFSQELDNPWLVSLQLRDSGRLKHNCGGVVLSEDFVLTAAHCFKIHGSSSYVVRVGEYKIDQTESSQEDFVIEKMWVHDEFDTSVEFNNDIAILKVARKNRRGIRFGPSVQPVCLPREDDPYTSLRDCTISGWGTLSEQSPPVAQNVPRAARVTVYDMAACTGPDGYGNYEVTSGMVCAGNLDGSVDTCTGDSGGPLTCRVNGRHVLYGITSWGKGCGRRGQPGMYTKITKFLRWIHDTIA